MQHTVYEQRPEDNRQACTSSFQETEYLNILEHRSHKINLLGKHIIYLIFLERKITVQKGKANLVNSSVIDYTYIQSAIMKISKIVGQIPYVFPFIMVQNFINYKVGMMVF